MLITSKGRYALRLMIAVALHDAHGPLPLKEAAGADNMPVKYLEQLARPLMRAGMLNSVRGQRGGYVLGQPADRIVVGDILRVAEGGKPTVACDSIDPNGQSCPNELNCTTVKFWKGLEDVIAQYVDGVTLADLAKPFALDISEEELAAALGEALPQAQ